MLHLQLIIIKYLLKKGSFTLYQILVHNILNSVLSIEKTDLNLKDVTPSPPHTLVDTFNSTQFTCSGDVCTRLNRAMRTIVFNLMATRVPWLPVHYEMHITKFTLIIFHGLPARGF